MGEAFAVPSPSAGVLEQEGCANYSFPGSDSFVLISSPFPGEPSGGGREYGLLQSMKEKRRESLEAQLRGKKELGEGTKSKANVQIASLGQGGSSGLGFENLIKQRLCCIKGILYLWGDGPRDLRNFFRVLFSVTHH